MHYDDEEAIERATLRVVFYKHGVSDLNTEYDADGNVVCENDEEYDIDLTSIQECKLINPYQLGRFINRYDLMFDEHFKDMKFEESYLFEFKSSGYGDVVFKSKRILELGEGNGTLTVH